MSAQVYGLQSNRLVPGKDFRASTDATGKTTGSMTFTIRRGDYRFVSDLLIKGTLLSALYPQCDPYFSPMVVDFSEYAENETANGMDVIRVNFIGYFENSAEYADRQKVYDLTTSLGETPTIRHPKFLLLDQSTNSPANGMIRLYHGTARWEETSSGILIVDSFTGDEIVEITGGEEMEWFDCIFRRDNKTWKTPTSEYTETQTNLGGLTTAEVADMGKIDIPPNSPATPPNMDWMLTGSSETRSSDNPITWTRTWSTIEQSADNTLLYT